MKGHMFTPDQIVRSVLLGDEVQAVCGVKRKHTRESVDAAVDCTPCSDCIKKANIAIDEYTVHAPRGWLALLERHMKQHLEPRAKTVSINYVGSFAYGDDWAKFPPAV